MNTKLQRDTIRRNHFDHLSEFYESHRRELLSYTLYFTRNEEDAVDTLQETFCLAMEDLCANNTQVENPRAWLIRIARNIMLRRQSRARQEALLWQRKTESESRPNNFTPEILNGLLMDQILNFVQDQYTQSMQEIFILRHMHEMNLAEIAEVTELPLTTVHRLLEKITNDVQQRFCSKSGD